jgi:hypothetical protein
MFTKLATKLNPVSHLLALLGAHPKVHASRIKVVSDLYKVHHEKKNIIIPGTHCAGG